MRRTIMAKQTRILAIALAAGLGIAASGAATAQGGMGPGMMGYGQGGMGPGMMGYGQGGMGHGMMGFGQGGMSPGMMQHLEPEQRRQMRELMQQHRSTQFERMGQMMDLRQEMMEVMHAERPDPEQVQALHGQMGELRGEMMAEMVRMRGNMLDLLTDEQRQQLRWGAGSPNSSP